MENITLTQLKAHYIVENKEHGFLLLSNEVPMLIGFKPCNFKKLYSPGKISLTDEHLNLKRLKYDKSYLEMANVWAKNSHCNRRQVGCLLVKNSMIISDGFNGLPSGYKDENGESCNDCEKDGQTRWEVLHAESNALTKLASWGGASSQDCWVYVTTSPCSECSKLLVQAKVKRVIFKELYRDLKGLQLLLNSGIEIVQYA